MNKHTPGTKSRSNWLLAAGAAALLSLGLAPCMAADAPAVSRLNGKADVSMGSFDGEHSTILGGSLTSPITHSTGVQIDGGIGEISADDYWGLGMHLFTRNPDKGLAGLIVSHQQLDQLALNHAGVEGDLYFKAITLHASTGYQWGDVREGAFVQFGGRYYPMDSLMIEALTECNVGSWLQRVGVEYNPDLKALPGLALYAEGALGEASYDRWIVGVRYYFGAQKDLKSRHRQDDPLFLLPTGLGALNGAVARWAEKRMRERSSGCHGYDNGYNYDE